MISLRIKNIKKFMSALLVSEMFDEFLLDSAVIDTANTYTIDGHVHREFFEEDEEKKELRYELSKWRELRPVCYELIKGKHTPLGFKFILCVDPDNKEELLAAGGAQELNNLISSLMFILKFKDGVITLTTGAALSGFTLDKSYEGIWDAYIQRFLASAGVEFEEL